MDADKPIVKVGVRSWHSNILFDDVGTPGFFKEMKCQEFLEK